LGGHCYEGDWLRGKKNGPGTLIFGNGDKYFGDFKNDFYDGDGEITYKNGDKFVGKFHRGMVKIFLNEVFFFFKNYSERFLFFKSNRI
jgi:hypothetical protein